MGKWGSEEVRKSEWVEVEREIKYKKYGVVWRMGTSLCVTGCYSAYSDGILFFSPTDLFPTQAHMGSIRNRCPSSADVPVCTS